MSRSVSPRGDSPRHTGSFPESRRGAPSRLADAECGFGGKFIARTARRRRATHPLTRLLGSAVLAFAPVFDCPAESRIGRLFSTVDQRIELDRLRDLPVVEPAVEPAAPEMEAQREPRLARDPESGRDAPVLLVTVNGVVLRSDGHRLAWVDGMEAGAGAEVPGRAGVEIDRTPGRRIRIRWPERGVHVDLKPGQTIDVVRGSVFEPYEPHPLRGGTETSGARAPEPDIATSAGVRPPCPLPIRGCGLGSAED